MIFAAEFQNLMTRMNVNQSDVEFANTIWSAAERVCHGKPSQVPVLLKTQDKERNQDDVASFTQKDLMVLKNHFATFIRLLDELREEEKQFAAIQWTYCDKSNPESLGSFKIYNETKDNERKFKAMVNKLAEIQRKVKKQLSK